MGSAISVVGAMPQGSKIALKAIKNGKYLSATETGLVNCNGSVIGAFYLCFCVNIFRSKYYMHTIHLINSTTDYFGFIFRKYIFYKN